MPDFCYDAQVPARYPGLAGGVLLADGLQNHQAVPALAELYAAETDAANHVMARHWCWWQSMESAAKPHTMAVIVTCEAHHVGGREAVAQALDDLAQMLTSYTGGHVRTKAVLGVGQNSV